MNRRKSVLYQSQPTSFKGFISDVPVPVFDLPSKEEPPKPIKKLQRACSYVFGSSQQPILPTIKSSEQIPRITAETLASVLKGDYDGLFDKLFIIDCRFLYEYEAGHIKNAIHCEHPLDLIEGFMNGKLERSLLIFHCEFSANRGPTIAGYFRDFDRLINKLNYPFIYYPNVYVLDGGYKNFYEQYKDHCNGSYLRMLNEEQKTNGELQAANTKYTNEIEKLLKRKRELSMESSSILKRCPPSPGMSPIKRQNAALLASPIPCKKRAI